MATEAYLGEFEHLLLLALLRLGPGTYGVPIREEIEERAGRAVSFGAVYSTLRRLERRGYLESWTGGAEPVPGGRARKLVRITPAGIEVLQRSRERLARMAEGLQERLGET
jgi:DNA-binding PadR family transcriptional regulator